MTRMDGRVARMDSRPIFPIVEKAIAETRKASGPVPNAMLARAICDALALAIDNENPPTEDELRDRRLIRAELGEHGAARTSKLYNVTAVIDGARNCASEHGGVSSIVPRTPS